MLRAEQGDVDMINMEGTLKRFLYNPTYI